MLLYILIIWLPTGAATQWSKYVVAYNHNRTSLSILLDRTVWLNTCFCYWPICYWPISFLNSSPSPLNLWKQAPRQRRKQRQEQKQNGKATSGYSFFQAGLIGLTVMSSAAQILSFSFNIALWSSAEVTTQSLVGTTLPTTNWLLLTQSSFTSVCHRCEISSGLMTPLKIDWVDVLHLLIFLF